MTPSQKKKEKIKLTKTLSYKNMFSKTKILIFEQTIVIQLLLLFYVFFICILLLKFKIYLQNFR